METKYKCDCQRTKEIHKRGRKPKGYDPFMEVDVYWENNLPLCIHCDYVCKIENCKQHEHLFSGNY